MSDRIVLSLRTTLTHTIEMDGVTADRMAHLDAAAIAALPVWAGRLRATVGDFFAVTGGHATSLRIEGITPQVHGVAAGTAGGDTTIVGDAGHQAAAAMSGGLVIFEGDVGDEAGGGMSGGLLRITGSAGDRLGSARPGSKGMTGGEIIVRGSAGRDTGTRIRRGLIAVGGDIATNAGQAMIAGTLVSLGRIDGPAGRGNKRGSIVALGGVDVPATYRYACTYEPAFLRVLLTYLRRRQGLLFDASLIGAPYDRYCGDAGEPGKGELLRPAVAGLRP